MSNSLNEVKLIGNLGYDPEISYTKSGKAVCNFSLATTDYNEKTQWHRIVVWDKAAESTAKFMRKGSKVFVAGRLDYRTYEGNDGNTKYITEIVADRVLFLDGKSDEQSSAPQTKSKRGAKTDEEMPF